MARQVSMWAGRNENSVFLFFGRSKPRFVRGAGCWCGDPTCSGDWSQEEITKLCTTDFKRATGWLPPEGEAVRVRFNVELL
jgi:hypothetical protein